LVLAVEKNDIRDMEKSAEEARLWFKETALPEE